MESCAKSQYSSSVESSPASSSLSCSDSDTSENGGTSLLHQALKRKRTDSETEQLFKRQFFLTAAPPNHYFNTTVTNAAHQNTEKSIGKPATSVLTPSSKFEPRFITRPLQSSQGLFTQTGSTTRPIFHIIQAPNRNLKLSATHVELCQLLQNTNSSSAQQPPSSENTKLLTTAPVQSNAKESETKNLN